MTTVYLFQFVIDSEMNLHYQEYRHINDEHSIAYQIYTVYLYILYYINKQNWKILTQELCISH